MEHSITGSVLLCCKAKSDRTLQCRVAIETPPGRDFGRTALVLVEGTTQLTEASYADYTAHFAGSEFPEPMFWNLARIGVAPPLPPPEQRAAICAQH